MGNYKRFILFLLALSWVLVTLVPGFARAFSASETAPGIVELRARGDDGLMVTHLQSQKTKKGSWVYFCVAEKKNATRHSSKEKCFYGSAKLFGKIHEGSEFQSIEYGLKSRLFNDKGRIKISPQRYFYSAQVLYGVK